MSKEFTSINNSYCAIYENLSSNNEEKDPGEEGEMDNDICSEKIYNIFNYKANGFDKDNIKENDLYLCPNKKSSVKKIKFITKLIKKKRGKHSNLNKKNKKTHDKYDFDNILAKVKNHSLSLVVPFLNSILKVLLIEEEFFQLKYEYKKNIKKKCFSEEKKKTLGDIIINSISSKYTKYENDINYRTLKKVKDHEIFKKILNMNYITFFKRYYMESKKCINLKDYGLENEVILSEKCKMYNDLIKKNKDNENYIKRIKNCIYKNYFEKKLFKTNK